MDSNQAAYELNIAKSLLALVADRLESHQGDLDRKDDLCHTIYAATDAIERARAIIDEEQPDTSNRG